MLQFLAARIVDDAKQANTAVENCWRNARRRSPRFKYEGEFRGWLLRVLIDEALAFRNDRQQTAKPVVLPGVLKQVSQSKAECESEGNSALRSM